MRLVKTVVLVGMMGAGKTAVGTALARQLGVAFKDSDEEIVRAANRTIAEIFERDGEPFFRARETEVIARLLRGTPCVLSTGGGAFLAEANRSLIHDAGVSVWLKADLELLWQRVRHTVPHWLDDVARPIYVVHFQRNVDLQLAAEATRLWLTLPQGACRTWTSLYAGLDEFITDLEEHMRLENDVLFPQFEPGNTAHA